MRYCMVLNKIPERDRTTSAEPELRLQIKEKIQIKKLAYFKQLTKPYIQKNLFFFFVSLHILFVLFGQLYFYVIEV